MPYKFNPFTSTLDITTKSEYTEFVYNSSATQSKNVYSNWSDLVSAISNVNGEKKIVFEQNETLPAGTYTLENTIWLGNGFPAGAGGVTITLPTGFVLNEVPSLRIDNFLKVTSTSTSPIMTITGGHNCLIYNNSQLASTTAEFYKIETDALGIVILFGGCLLLNEGYEVVNLNGVNAIMSLAFLAGGNGMTTNAYRGTGLVLVQAFDASPQDNISYDWLYNTQANFSGTLQENLQNRADYISYDNGTSGLTADRVQAAIDELDTRTDSYGCYGAFHSDTDQIAANTTTAYALIAEIEDEANNVSMETDGTDLTKLTFATAGTYNIQFSIQFVNSDNAEHDFNIWFSKNGTDISASNSQFTIPKEHSGTDGKLIAVINLVNTVSAGDYIQIYWQVENTSVSIQQLPAGTTPTTPTTPSVILTAWAIK